MAVVRKLIFAAGFAMVLMGVLWITQGLGYVRWPQSSFMLGNSQWADYGSALAILGLLFLLAARRLPRR